MKAKLFKRLAEEIEKKCETCKWWVAPGLSSYAIHTPSVDFQSTVGYNPVRRGECHCNPPQSVKTFSANGETIHTGVFPVVLSTDWCGKHEGR